MWTPADNRFLGFLDWREGRKARAEREEVRKIDTRQQQHRTPPVIEKAKPAVKVSKRAVVEKQIPLFETLPAGKLPPLTLLDDPPPQQGGYSQEELEVLSRQVERKLADFKVEVKVVGVLPGPVVTRFELEPAPGVKVSQIVNLAKDIARGLSVISVRVVDVIPGKPYIGLEIPNTNREIVYLSEILRSVDFDKARSYRQNAAFAGGRHHRFGQVRGRQCHAYQPALQGHTGRNQADSG